LINNIEHKIHRNQRSIQNSVKSTFFLCLAFMFLFSGPLRSQVLNNDGAAISLTPGVYLYSKDVINNSGSNIINDGTINLSGNYTSTATTSGNGLYTLMGNWTNTSGIFIPGTSTVIFNGSANQSIIRTGGENFYNLSIGNTGTDPNNRVGISQNVQVLGTLSMSVGNIDAGTWVLYLSNTSAASLNYTSTSKSRIFGRFERGVGQAGNYLFPVGTPSYYNPANLTTNNTPTSGSILTQYFTAPPTGGGFPFPDPPVEIYRTYPDGYWSLTAKNGFASGNFNVNIKAEGFNDSIHDNTRVIKRTAGSDWLIDGTHQDADTVNSIIYRNDLTGGISSLGTQFALGRARPLIIDHPHDTTVCEETNPTFTVIATGTQALRYTWYKVALPADIEIVNGAHYNGARTPTLTIISAELADTGYYYCIVRDRYRNSTRTDSAHLTVKKIPRASVTPELQEHECSNIDFDPIVLGLTYYDDPGTTFLWTRDNPDGIVSSVPMSGSASNIGDVLSGSFTNITDAPIKVTFLVTPVGPDPTYCVGNPVPAAIMVNPTPRVIPVNAVPSICSGESTEITLTTPTTMTKGSIAFDYTVSFTGAPGDLTGSTTPQTDLYPGYQITLPYENTSDTIQSVYYTITPKNNDLVCTYDSIRIPEVKVHAEPLQDLYISTPFTCTGGSDGALTAVLSRGSKPDSLKWERPWVGEISYSTSENTDILPVQYVGNYRVTVTDELGCSRRSDYIFISGAVLDTYLYVKDKANNYGTTCPESNDGELWVKETSGSTGVAPFVYTIIYNGQDTVAHNDTLYTKESWNYYYNLPPGNYRIYIRDVNGCINFNYPSIDILPPDEITVEFDKYEYPGGYNISCLGYSDGSVGIDTIYGGSGGYTYKWTKDGGTITGPDTLDHIDNVSAGKYYLTTTDWLGCTKLDSVILTEPDGMILSGSEVSWSNDSTYNVSCNGGSDGYIKVTITGGSGNYLYSWSGPAGYTAMTRDISGLAAGTYTCIVTDVNGCILTPNPVFTLTEPAPLTIDAVPSLSTDGSYNINCYGGTGSIDVTMAGGSVGNYSYSWSTEDGSGLVDGQEDQTGLTIGTYHLVAVDSNGCISTADVKLTQPQPLALTLDPTDITCNPPGFNNGTIDLTVSGGVGPYTYNWSNGATTEDVSGLTEGYYSVTVTDINGCSAADSAMIKLPPPLLYDILLSDYTGYNVRCYGQSNGTININSTSGTPPYTFRWTGPDGYTSSDRHITDLRAGEYTMVLSDANLCTATEVIEVTQPDRLTVDATLSSSVAGGYNINCVGDSTGTIDIVPVNNVGNVTYLWSDGSTSDSRTGLPAGDYGLIVMDENSCYGDTTITLTQPDSIIISSDITQPWCPDTPDGEISLTVTGGVVGTDYEYDWSDNSTTRELTDIYSGTFIVTVSDLNQCSVTDTIYLEPENETCLIIPNAFSPDGNLINDEWNIGMMDIYPQAEVKVFNRWGIVVWRSEKGYPQPWDGRSNGKLLPVDSYHYIIDLNNGSKPIVGTITIVHDKK